MLSFEASKANFFDRAVVLQATTRAERRVLSRFGAFVRARIQSSMLGHVVRRGFGIKSRTRNREGMCMTSKGQLADSRRHLRGRHRSRRRIRRRHARRCSRAPGLFAVFAGFETLIVFRRAFHGGALWKINRA